jgi:hypothetical protein
MPCGARKSAIERPTTLPPTMRTGTSSSCLSKEKSLIVFPLLFPKVILMEVYMLLYGKARARYVPWIVLVEMVLGNKRITSLIIASMQSTDLEEIKAALLDQASHPCTRVSWGVAQVMAVKRNRGNCWHCCEDRAVGILSKV